jgi:hypothetical protein
MNTIHFNIFIPYLSKVVSRLGKASKKDLHYLHFAVKFILNHIAVSPYATLLSVVPLYLL